MGQRGEAEIDAFPWHSARPGDSGRWPNFSQRIVGSRFGPALRAVWRRMVLVLMAAKSSRAPSGSLSTGEDHLQRLRDVFAHLHDPGRTLARAFLRKVCGDRRGAGKHSASSLASLIPFSFC